MFLFYRIFPFFLLCASFEVLKIPVIGITLLRFLAALCVIAIFLDCLYQVSRDSKRVRIRLPLDIKLFLLFLVNSIIICWGYESDQRYAILVNSGMLVLLYCFVRMYAINTNNIIKTFKYITLGFLFGSIISYLIYKNVILIPSYLIEDFRLEEGRSRFVGLLRNPNRYGLYAMLSLFSLLLWIMFRVKSKRNFVSILILALMILAHVFFLRESFSRAAITGTLISFVSLFVLAFCIDKTIRGKLVIGFSVFVSLGFLVMSLDNSFALRFDITNAYASGSGLNRNILLIESLNVIQSNPILGFIGNPNVESFYTYNVSAHDPHNTFLFNWLHHGFFGMLIIVGILFWIFKESVSNITRENYGASAICTALLIGVLAFCLMHSTTHWKGFIICLALISSISAVHKQKQHS